MIFPTGALRSFEDDSKLYPSFPVKNAGEVMRKIDEDLSKIALLLHGVATILY